MDYDCTGSFTDVVLHDNIADAVFLCLDESGLPAVGTLVDATLQALEPSVPPTGVPGTVWAAFTFADAIYITVCAYIRLHASFKGLLCATLCVKSGGWGGGIMACTVPLHLAPRL